jgi:hypothetical protein
VGFLLVLVCVGGDGLDWVVQGLSRNLNLMKAQGARTVLRIPVVLLGISSWDVNADDIEIE